MRPIPQALKNKLSNDKYMESCILTQLQIPHDCSGNVEWHHVWTYNKKQINEHWAILPICHNAHIEEQKYRHILQYISLEIASDDELLKYPKGQWWQLKQRAEYICGQHMREILNYLHLRMVSP